MNQFHIKSILLGIGIGFILASIISMIYLAGRDPVKELTREQIITEAEKYGMVKASLIQRDEVNGASIFQVEASVKSNNEIGKTEKEK